jgi:thiamine biosynthesis lipoprotein
LALPAQNPPAEECDDALNFAHHSGRLSRGLSVLSLLLAPLLLVACESAPPVVSRSELALGTLAELKVVAAREEAERALARAFAEIRSIEEATSVYSDSSDVAALARRAGEGVPVSVGAHTDRILADAVAIARETHGAFDPTVGPLNELWGFRDQPARPPAEALARARELVSFRWLRRSEEDAGRPAWLLERAGMAVDLGGIAKGYAADRAADILAEPTGSCLVNLGGDLAIRGAHPARGFWTIGIQDPLDPSRILLTLSISGSVAVATSGDYQRFFEEDGVRYHHLLDPATGEPARGARSATVLAPTCAVADAWATAVFVMGPERGIAALEAEPRLEGMIVTDDGSGRLVLHETSGFAAFRRGRS